MANTYPSKRKRRMAVCKRTARAVFITGALWKMADWGVEIILNITF